MNWFYVEANQQRGPVSDEQLQELFRARKLSPDTMVWREGMANWQPYSSVQQGNPPPEPLPANATTTCGECGRSFPSDEIVRIHNSWICAACKPIFLQRILEGAPSLATGVSRSGKVLVAAKGAAFPDRCVKCNAPVNGFRLKRNLYWYPPYVLLLIVLSLLIGLIVAMIVRKNARVEIGLCELHRSKRVRSMVIGALVTFAGLASLLRASPWKRLLWDSSDSGRSFAGSFSWLPPRPFPSKKSTRDLSG